MKAILPILFLIASYSQVFGVMTHYADNPEVGHHLSDMHPDIMKMTVDDFLNMKPRDYRKITGKRLGIKNAVKLKLGQRFFKKKMKKADANISSGLYVLLAILGLGWLAMGLMSDWSGDDWIINLILTLLCWLPGLIHALVKKKDYY